MKIKNFLSFLPLVLLSFIVKGEEEQSKPVTPPNAEIHLFDLTIENGRYALENGVNISDNLGYDNQPYFTDDSESILFVSQRDGKQTDVYEYFIKTKKTNQITNTEHSEYSPKSYNKNQSITFVNEGNNPYQSVWKLDRKTDKSSWLLNSKEPVGYYATNAETGDVLFWSRYGWSVNYLNIKRNEGRFISGNALPSSPQQMPNSENFSFVHRQTNSQMWIKAVNPTDFSITPIAPIYGENFEYTWSPNGDILRIDNNQLYVWPKNNKTNRWQTGQDLSQYFIGNATRLSISHDGKHIALVENR